mgnify:FL=1
MRLLKLEILNLASLDKPEGEVINFDQGALGETSIFSIVGPTGSGKSTILDAICLALYNIAPRYPRKKGESKRWVTIFGNANACNESNLSPTDSQNILTRGQKKGYSKLTFLANNGSIYRAEWHVEKKSKNYQDPVTQLFKLVPTGQGYSEESCQWEDLPQIIGLDYEQFLRTVLIAQGSFANFLTSKEDERYALLEKLIGCEALYSNIAQKITDRRAAAKELYYEAKAQADAILQFQLSPEDLQALNEHIAALEAAEQQLEQRLQEIDKALEWYNTERKLAADLERQKAAEAKAKADLDAIKGAVDRLTLHDAILPAIDMLREVRQLEHDIAKVQNELEALTLQIKQQQDAISDSKQQKEVLDNKVKEAMDEIEKAKPHIDKARELRTLMAPAKNAFDEKKKALDAVLQLKNAADKAVADNAKAIESAQKQKSKAQEALSQQQTTIEAQKKHLLEAETKAIATLADERKKVEGQTADALQQSLASASENYNDLKQAIEIVDNINLHSAELQKHTVRQQQLIQDNAQLRLALNALTIPQLQQEVDALQTTFTLMTSEQWEVHRASLEEDKPCPLCGSLHHPYTVDSTQFNIATSTIQKSLNDTKSTLLAQQQQEKTLNSTLNKNEGELKTLTTAISKEQNSLDAAHQKWSVLSQKHPDWTQDKPLLEVHLVEALAHKEQCQKDLTAFNKTQEEIARLTTLKDKASKEKSDYDLTAAKALEKATQAVADADTLLTGHTAQTANLLQQQADRAAAVAAATKDFSDAENLLKQYQQQFNTELGGKDPDKEEQRLHNNKKAAEEAVGKKMEAITHLEKQLSVLQGTFQSKTTDKQQHLTNLNAKKEALSQWMAAHTGPAAPLTLSTVEALLTSHDNWEQIRQQKEQCTYALTSATTLKEKVLNDHASHLQHKPLSNAEELAIEKANLSQQSHRPALEAERLRLKQHNDSVKQMGDRAATLQQAQSDYDDWQAIATSIGTNGTDLRKIAQCYTLRFLIEHANAEIRKFNSRYELIQVPNSLGIRVVDHDRAGDVRDTTTLSGGETFIVSLGLALGLSSLSSRNISFDNLFIDEGFGTLDPDTLATVIDSLAMLQTSQGKKVGVISHTDTMSERITTQIRIIKNGNSGSSHIEIFPQ